MPPTRGRTDRYSASPVRRVATPRSQPSTRVRLTVQANAVPYAAVSSQDHGRVAASGNPLTTTPAATATAAIEPHATWGIPRAYSGGVALVASTCGPTIAAAATSAATNARV